MPALLLPATLPSMELEDMKHAKDEVKMEESDEPAKLTGMSEDGSQGLEGKAGVSERSNLAEITDKSLLKQKVLELIDRLLLGGIWWASSIPAWPA